MHLTILSLNFNLINHQLISHLIIRILGLTHWVEAILCRKWKPLVLILGLKLIIHPIPLSLCSIIHRKQVVLRIKWKAVKRESLWTCIKQWMQIRDVLMENQREMLSMTIVVEMLLINQAAIHINLINLSRTNL